jgi:hypothetical protein
MLTFIDETVAAAKRKRLVARAARRQRMRNASSNLLRRRRAPSLSVFYAPYFIYIAYLRLLYNDAKRFLVAFL